ncbi:GNAT family N-acetyltransferase [bacterium]|nr:GNAT family N-acetyltransferase [bacterium]
MSLSVRAYEDGDLEACRQLWVDLTQRHRDLYDSPDIGGDDPGKQLDEHLRRPDFAGLWVAVDGGEIFGLVGLLHSGEETEVEPIVVRPGHRSRGIGKHLLDHVCAEAAKYEVGYLSIRPVARNVEAMAMFVNEGFDRVGHVQLLKALKPTQIPWRDGMTMHGKKLRF